MAGSSNLESDALTRSTPARESERPTAADTSRGHHARMPERIGQYAIRRIIGVGGMGTVYEALQEHPRRTVALKVMRAGITSASALRRFEYESQVLGQLHHPGIVQVFESGTATDSGDSSLPVPFFAMEYITKPQTLTQYVREKQLSLPEKLQLFSKVCEAVAHGHLHGVIHRDLKPENILIDSAGQPKIIDFGVARAVDANTIASTEHTDVGQLIGTIQYMSPEQIDADPRDIDSRSDVYALGVVLYELLCDRLPYAVSKSDILGAAHTIKEGTPARPSTIYRRLRGDLEAIVLKALEKDRKRRYQTADELCRDIQQYLKDEPLITARRSTTGYVLATRARGVLKRQPVAAVLACVVLAAGIITELLGVQAVYRWTSANDWYYGWLTSSFGPDRHMKQFEHVRLIHLDDETVNRMPELAERLQIENLDPEDKFTWRPLHGRLMERLAPLGVKAVAFDFKFTDDNPDDDADFVRGVQALRETGVRVTVNALWSRDEEFGRPFLSSAFVDHVQTGGFTIVIPQRGIWQADLFVQRGWTAPIPSLGLATVAAALNPKFEPQYTFQEKTLELQLSGATYPDPNNHRFLVRMPEEMERLFPLSSAEYLYEVNSDDEEVGLQVNDRIGYYFVEPPPQPAIEASTIAYHEIFDMKDDALRQAIGGKIVMIADARAPLDVKDPRDDWHEYGDSLVHGSVGHAAVVDLMMRGSPIRLERTTFARWTVIASTLVGLIVAALGRGNAMRRWMILAVCAVLFLIGSIIAYSQYRYIINPIVPVLAMIVACELAAIIQRVRQGRPA